MKLHIVEIGKTGLNKITYNTKKNIDELVTDALKKYDLKLYFPVGDDYVFILEYNRDKVFKGWGLTKEVNEKLPM